MNVLLDRPTRYKSKVAHRSPPHEREESIVTESACSFLAATAGATTPRPTSRSASTRTAIVHARLDRRDVAVSATYLSATTSADSIEGQVCIHPSDTTVSSSRRCWLR